MSVNRRAGAPRLIDWTGERCVPWAPDVQVVYEHYHRYLWAAELVRGRRVLDLGSGEGFGSAILAGVAEHVCGVDIDPDTVEHSRLNYAAPNLEFRIASALDLSEFEPDAFNAVVAFEMIEHISAHEQLLEQVERVLRADGLFIVSTPDRRLYSGASGVRNPFHQRELDEVELRALLESRFEHVAFWGQRATYGSRIAVLNGAGSEPSQSIFLERSGDEWRARGEPTPMYLIAVASHAQAETAPRESNLADYGLESMGSKEREAQRVIAALEELRAEEQRVRADRDRLAAEFGEVRAEERRVRADRDRLAAEFGEVRAEERRVRADRDRLAAEFGEVRAEERRVRADRDRLAAEFGEVRAEERRVRADRDRLAQTLGELQRRLAVRLALRMDSLRGPRGS